MGTYLFTWNPVKWPWANFDESIATLTKTGQVSKSWRCISHKKIQPGDRAFLARVGVDPRGIIGSGIVTTPPFLSADKNNSTKSIYRVTIQFDILLNAEKEPILTSELLRLGRLAAQNWAPQGSGISIKPGLVNDLEDLWLDFTTSKNEDINL